MSLSILTSAVACEPDVVAARRRARDIADLLGFDAQDQTRIATAVSEIARNAVQYGGGGKIEFLLEGATRPQVLLIRISDSGSGIRNLNAVLHGEYQSQTGMGLGIIGARRLADQFDIESAPGAGTRVLLKKVLPRTAPVRNAPDLMQIAKELAQRQPKSMLEEVREQNLELLRALDELRRRQDELTTLNHELEDTNRGVVALYAELDEKADHLRRADELKSRFLSNMSHEFRTPVNSIVALSRLLLDRSDGELTSEQEKQVEFIRKAAEGLSELVNDLLDLAKVEAGKIAVRPGEFRVGDLFGALRGMLRPLLVNESVTLVFEDAGDLPELCTDESKVSQILRNFISNALKFTERGEVRVAARLNPARDAVIFSVADTGIGIAPEDQERVFQEFTQIESPLQKRVKGTGLGLPLTKKLAELLGGSVSVQSEVGVGSSFSAVIPLSYTPAVPTIERELEAWAPDPLRNPVLIVEDTPEDRLWCEKLLRGSSFQPLACRTLREARQVLRRVRPKAILLDILLPGEDSWSFLTSMKADPATHDVPIIVITTVEDERKGLALGADAYCLKPVERTWLLDTLSRLTARASVKRILVIDDDEVARYLLRQLLSDPRYLVTEATNGTEGLERAREEQPDVVLLDLMMPGMSGFEVLERFKADPVIRNIPVVVLTSKVLENDERQRLAAAAAVVSKEATARADALAAIQTALTANDISGYDVCRRIKSNPATSSVMVLQTSATYMDTAHVIQGLESGADNYLTEPVPPRVLVATVRALLRLRQMEEERDELLARERAARAEAEAANQAKDDFLATLSHELRTPVGAVLAWTHLLRTGNLDPEHTARALESIERSAKAQAQLIDDLLDVSRIIAGKLRVDRRSLSLATALRAAVEGVAPAAHTKGIRLEMRLDETISVDGDAARLQQVFGNLLSNAVKFTPAGGQVSVVLSAVETQAVITVSDTGKGISPDFLPFVFERFRQADTSTTRTESGLGLGLAIAQRIVELHGGSIRADSRGAGCGTTFTVSLPLPVLISRARMQ